MALTISKETAQDLKNVVDMVRKIDVDYKKCEPAYTKAEANLREAIDDQSEDELELFRPQMLKALKELDGCIHSIDGALALLRHLRKDEALMESRTDQINQLVKGLVDKQQKLTAHAARGRAMVMDEAQKALAAAKNGAMAIETELSELKSIVERAEKDLRTIEGQAKTAEAAVLAAQKAGDTKLMIAARTRFLDLGFRELLAAAPNMLARATRLLPRLKDGPQRAECQWAIDSVRDLAERCRALDARHREMVALKAVEKPATPEPKAKKKPRFAGAQVLQIAKLLTIDPKDGKAIATLTKLVNLYHRLEWAEQFVKQLGCKKADAEAAFRKIEKLPFVQATYLIDI